MANANAPDSLLQREIKQFSELLESFKSICGGLLAVITVLPFGGLLAENTLLPPWLGKANVWLAFVASLMTVIVLFYLGKEIPTARISWWVRVLIGGGVASFVIYLVLLASHVVDVDGERHVIGLALTNEARDKLEKKIVISDTPKDFLHAFGYESDGRIWERIWVVNVVLVVCFSATFAFLSGAFFLLLLGNARSAYSSFAPPRDMIEITNRK